MKKCKFLKKERKAKSMEQEKHDVKDEVENAINELEKTDESFGCWLES
jgi:hypothetical protein